MLIRFKFLILILFLTNSLFAQANYRNVSLLDFSDSVSAANHINIFIDEDLTKENISFFIPTLHNPKLLLSAFKISLDKKGLKLLYKNGFYYISKKEKYKIHNYLIKLSYNCSNDFKKYLNMFSYKYTYFKSNNSLIISCDYLQKQRIDIFLKKLDKQSSQVILKFLILSYDSNIINERGIKFGSVYKALDGTIQSAINTIVFPFSSKTNIINSTSFYAALRFLNTDKDITVNQFPYILAKNNNPFKFESVQNIPYLIKNVQTDSNTVQDNNSYEYKDVGLKIHGTTSIYKKFITLDLDLTIEDIINTSQDNKTPSTNKRYLNSVTNLKFNQVLLLSGIKQKKEDITDIKVPILSGIPFIGKMFEYKYKTHTLSNISVAIQVLNVNDVDEANATLLSSEVRASSKE